MDFEKYAIQIKHPIQPTKPMAPPPNAKAEAYREHANKLDQYEVAMAEYNTLCDTYEEDRARLYGEFKVDALKEVGLWGHDAGNSAFEYAWQKCDTRQEVFEMLVAINYIIEGPK